MSEELLLLVYEFLHWQTLHWAVNHSNSHFTPSVSPSPALAAAAAAKSLQSCLTLCDPIDGSPIGSPIPGILQARTLEWVAISFSNAWKWKVKVKSLSRVRLLATPWTAAFQAPPSMGFSRQEYWSGVPLPFPALTSPWIPAQWQRLARGWGGKGKMMSVLHIIDAKKRIMWCLLLSCIETVISKCSPIKCHFLLLKGL